MRFASFLLLLIATQAYSGSERIPETIRVYKTIDFSDDLDLVNMNKAIKRQLISFSKSDLSVKFKLGTLTYTRKSLKDSLELFTKYIDETLNCLSRNSRSHCYGKLSQKINQNFRIYRPVPLRKEPGYITGETKFTAYYSPDLHGSIVKTKHFQYPIYAKPKTVALQSLTREEIDFEGKLKGRGLELFYVSESLYDIWLFHVEGGGRVQVKDESGKNKFFYLSYDGTNKKAFNMLYKYMRQEGMLESGKTSITHQRAYFENNPEDRRSILASCPSYIYFKVTKDEPLGVKNIPLTENRSLATDYRLYKEYGILNFIQARFPQKLSENGELISKQSSRFMINQDTGGAIKGRARSDLYFGYGEKAEFTASYLNNLGRQYFLIKKN